MDDNDFKDRAYWQEVCDILQNHTKTGWTYKRHATLKFDKDNFVEYTEFQGRVADKLLILAQENKKLKKLIKKIYEDLEERAETNKDGYKTFDISHGIFLKMQEVLKE